VSGEHGIGLVKRELLARALGPEATALMRAIKAQFDPDGILNPGKVLPPG
jgi:D-lactate dehydrogenase